MYLVIKQNVLNAERLWSVNFQGRIITNIVEKTKLKDLKQGQRVAFLATLVTLLLAGIKAVVGHLFDSKILIADALHSGADFLAIFASGFGLWMASKKKTRRFPYGLYRVETLVSLIIGALIVWAGIEILQEGYNKLFYITHYENLPVLPVFASIISVIAAYYIARKEKYIGEQINSQSLIANARESFLDIITSFVVLTGILLAYAEIPYMEGAIIILISLLILKLGLENIWISILILIDANLDPELQADIEKEINEIYGVRGESVVNIRQAGPFKMVECKIETSPTLSLYRAHELADKAEDLITRDYEHIESVFIHVEPSKKKIVSVIIPVNEINGLESRVFGHFGRAPYYIILKLENSNIEIEDFYYNEFLDEKKHIGIKVIKAVINHKLDMLFTLRIGEISFYMLKDNFIDIYKIEEGLAVKEVIDKYLSGEVKQITAPTHPVEESESIKS